MKVDLIYDAFVTTQNIDVLLREKKKVSPLLHVIKKVIG